MARETQTVDPGQSGMGDFHTSREEEHQPGTNTTGCLALHPLLTFSSTSSHDPELPLDHVPELDIEPRPSDETEPEREEEVEELEREEEEVEEELRPDGGPDPNAKSSRNPMLPSMFSSSWFRVLVSGSSFSSLLTMCQSPRYLVALSSLLLLLLCFFFSSFSFLRSRIFLIRGPDLTH